MDSQRTDIDSVNPGSNYNNDKTANTAMDSQRTDMDSVNTGSNYSNDRTANATMDSANAGSNYNNDGATNARMETGNVGDSQQRDFGRDTSQNTDRDTFSRSDADAQNTSTRQDTERRDTNTNDSSVDQSQDGQNNQSGEERPKKGVAGVIASNFGADKTTTSTFEKSQGEKYGENFDETGERIKGRFSVDEGASGSAAGGGEYTMGGKQGDRAGQDTNLPRGQGSDNGGHKEGFGHKIMDKAEGIMHRHHHENRSEGQ